MSDVAVPGKMLGVVPSPQLTDIEETVPSGSAAVNVAATCCPVRAGFGETFVTVTVGTLSLIVSVVCPAPGPALFVAVTTIVKICDFEAPVLV